MTSCSAIGGATALSKSVRERRVVDLRSLPVGLSERQRELQEEFRSLTPTQLIQMGSLGILDQPLTPLLGLLILSQRLHQPFSQSMDPTRRLRVSSSLLRLRCSRLDLLLGDGTSLLDDRGRLGYDRGGLRPDRVPAPSACCCCCWSGFGVGRRRSRKRRGGDRGG